MGCESWAATCEDRAPPKNGDMAQRRLECKRLTSHGLHPPRLVLHPPQLLLLFLSLDLGLASRPPRRRRHAALAADAQVRERVVDVVLVFLLPVSTLRRRREPVPLPREELVELLLLFGLSSLCKSKRRDERSRRKSAARERHARGAPSHLLPRQPRRPLPSAERCPGHARARRRPRGSGLRWCRGGGPLPRGVRRRRRRALRLVRPRARACAGTCGMRRGRTCPGGPCWVGKLSRGARREGRCRGRLEVGEDSWAGLAGCGEESSAITGDRELQKALLRWTARGARPLERTRR